jgi:DNA-binding FrmR family transcriptional regulator
MSMKLADTAQVPRLRQTVAGFINTANKSGSSEVYQIPDPAIVHRLRSASGHLDVTRIAFETGQPSAQTLHQLGAVEAAIREASLAIVKNEMHRNLANLRNSRCDEQTKTAVQSIIELYERYCRLLWIR